MITHSVASNIIEDFPAYLVRIDIERGVSPGGVGVRRLLASECDIRCWKAYDVGRGVDIVVVGRPGRLVNVSPTPEFLLEAQPTQNFVPAVQYFTPIHIRIDVRRLK